MKLLELFSAASQSGSTKSIEIRKSLLERAKTVSSQIGVVSVASPSPSFSVAVMACYGRAHYSSVCSYYPAYLGISNTAHPVLVFPISSHPVYLWSVPSSPLASQLIIANHYWTQQAKVHVYVYVHY